MAAWPQVDNYEDVALDTARERLIGLTNRVIGGVLLHTTRMAYARCEDSRFAKIENNCASGTSIEPYGVDPVFVMGSTLFDPDLDNEKSLLHFYNCSEIPEAQRVYNLEDPYSSSGACICVEERRRVNGRSPVKPCSRADLVPDGGAS